MREAPQWVISVGRCYRVAEDRWPVLVVVAATGAAAAAAAGEREGR